MIICAQKLDEFLIRLIRRGRLRRRWIGRLSRVCNHAHHCTEGQPIPLCDQGLPTLGCRFRTRGLIRPVIKFYVVLQHLMASPEFSSLEATMSKSSRFIWLSADI